MIKESITLDGKIVAERNLHEITFGRVKMPKLSSEESLISIFKEEDRIKSAYEGFRKIVFRNHVNHAGQQSRFIYRGYDPKAKSKKKTLKEIRNSDVSTVEKLSCLYENQRESFDSIVENYKDVFQQIEDVKFEPLPNQRESSIFTELSMIQFKEKGVEKWILANKMSSGMIRAFMHISEMFLLAEGTVVLIDEFENSLGVNCIDVLTEDLIFENHNLQFIATSHHPYIINKIPYEHWKIVTRNRGKITAFDAKDFDLGESRHENFMSLINLPKFKKGIEHI